MENYLFYILILLSLLISILVIAVLALIFFYVRDRSRQTQQKERDHNLNPQTSATLSKPSVYRPPRAEGYCSNHSNEKAVALCAVCSKTLCEECASEAENLYFCSEHFQTYLENEWTSLTNIKTTPDNPSEGVALYEFKDNLWVREQVPTFIVTHYRINIENDFIESYVQLHVRKDDEDMLKEKIKGHL